MTEQARIAQREGACAARRSADEAQGRQAVQAREPIARRQKHLAEREALLGKERHANLKPAASDGLGRRLRLVRAPSGKRFGG